MKNKIAIPIIVILSIVILSLVLFINDKNCKGYKGILEQRVDEGNLIRDKTNCIHYTNKTIDIAIPELYIIENYYKSNKLIIYNHENETISATATISSKSNNVECVFGDTTFTKSDDYSIPPNNFRGITINVYAQPFIAQKQFCEVTVNLNQKEEKIKFEIDVIPDIMKNKYFCFNLN